MRSRNVVLALGALAILALIGWGMTTASSQEPAQPEEPAPTAPNPLDVGGDRLVSWVWAYSDPGPKTCFYDADVRFDHGKVGEIEKLGERAKDLIRTGDPISDLPPDMEEATTIPIPVHIGDDGKIRPGHDYCEEMP